MRETVEKEVIERLRRPYVKAVFQDSVAWGLLASMAFRGTGPSVGSRPSG